MMDMPSTAITGELTLEVRAFNARTIHCAMEDADKFLHSYYPGTWRIESVYRVIDVDWVIVYSKRQEADTAP